MVEMCHLSKKLLFVVKTAKGEYGLTSKPPKGFSLVNGSLHWRSEDFPDEINLVGNVIKELRKKERFLIGVIDYNDETQLRNLKLRY